jgi:hypothetical protein
MTALYTQVALLTYCTTSLLLDPNLVEDTVQFCMVTVRHQFCISKGFESLWFAHEALKVVLDSLRP